MLSLNSKLNRWVEQSLITANQREKIKTFEKEREGGNFLKGFFGIGIFAILIGVIAIVSANWYVIPAEVKLASHFILYLGALYGIYFADKKGSQRLTDVFLLIFFGLTLSFIGLVGQIYHLSGELGDTLAMWMTLTSPAILLYGRGHTIFLPWFAGLIATYCASVDLYFDVFNNKVFVLTSLFFAFSCLHLSGSVVHQHLQKLKNIFFHGGWISALVSVSLASVVWYDGISDQFYNDYLWVVLLSFFLFAISLFFLKLNHEDISAKDEYYFKLLLAVAIAISAAPFIVPIHFGLIGALLFVVFWMIAGYCFQKMGWQRMVTLALIIVAIRIYIIFLEVFGTLLETGLGLIISGVVMLLMGYGVKKIGAHLKQKGARK